MTASKQNRADLFDAWSEDEHDWVAQSIRPALETAWFSAAYERVSCCGGVFSLRRAEEA